MEPPKRLKIRNIFVYLIILLSIIYIRPLFFVAIVSFILYCLYILMEKEGKIL